MHSSYETAQVQDALYLENAMTVFFGSTLVVSGSGFMID